jgi:hypothetical protein
MKQLVWGLALVAAVLWSLLAWGTYALVEWVGRFAAANADQVSGHPEAVEWLSWAAGWLTSAGLAGVMVIWLAGIGLILAIPALVRWAARRAGGSDARRRTTAPPHALDRHGYAPHRQDDAPHRDGSAAQRILRSRHGQNLLRLLREYRR